LTLGTLVLGGLLAGLALLALLTLVRLLRTLRRRQALARFQAAAAEIAAGLAREGNPLVRDIDDLRRRAQDVGALELRLASATPALQALAARARGGLHAPAGLEPLAAAIAGEASRAVRSAELARVGIDALQDRRNMRETEAATSLKRAALNLRNAIDEAGRLAARTRDLRPADLDRPGAIAGAIATASLPSYGSTDDDLPIGT
jgi:hypothetical protein